MRDGRLLYCLPEGSRGKSPCAGWVLNNEKAKFNVYNKTFNSQLLHINSTGSFILFNNILKLMYLNHKAKICIYLFKYKYTYDFYFGAQQFPVLACGSNIQIVV